MNGELLATKRTYAGLFMVMLATLMYEILLTRIFSVTMWYHFAFVAISVAMFGMIVGAVLVYLFPRFFTWEKAKQHLALSALLFALSIVASFLTHLSIPFIVHRSIVGLYLIALTYVVIAVPFVFSGVAVCLALTRFPGQVSRLYAVDLAGAALGCIVLVYTLKILDGPTTVVVGAFLAAIGAVLFASDGAPRLRRFAAATGLVFAAFVAIHGVLAARQTPLLHLVWVKQALEYPRPLYEKWNSFSRITISDERRDARLQRPVGWGLSSVYPGADRRVRQLGLSIDATAGTVLTGFSGNLAEVEHLKYDVTNIVHYVRPDARVLVVGTGGGRDILAALAFGQRAILGVEINKDIIRAVNVTFGDFHRSPRPAPQGFVGQRVDLDGRVPFEPSGTGQGSGHLGGLWPGGLPSVLALGAAALPKRRGFAKMNGPVAVCTTEVASPAHSQRRRSASARGSSASSSRISPKCIPASSSTGTTPARQLEKNGSSQSLANTAGPSQNTWLNPDGRRRPWRSNHTKSPYLRSGAYQSLTFVMCSALSVALR